MSHTVVTVVGNMLAERFWSKVDVRGPDDCWPWTAGVTKQGYGGFHPTKYGMVLAHRWVYEETFGRIEDGKHVDHTCHNGAGCPPGPCPHRLCCNPAHLEAVPPGENVNRSHNSNQRKTHCPRGHEYTPENTRVQVTAKTASRSCRTCTRERDRNRGPRNRKRESNNGR